MDGGEEGWGFKAAMRESVFNGEVVRSLRAQGAWAHKIPDLPQSMISGMRFNPEKPFDIVAFIRGKGVAIEGKQLKKYEAFGERHMRPAQITELNKIVDSASGRAFVFLNIRRGEAPRMNRLIVFVWERLRERFKEGSIKKTELESLPYIEGKKGEFDLSDFMGGL